MKIKATSKGSEIVFTANKCNRPKFKSHRGRTWDTLFTMIFSDMEEVNTFIDTSWGQAHYFSIAGQWYKVTQSQKVFIDGKMDTYFPFEDLGYHCNCEIIRK